MFLLAALVAGTVFGVFIGYNPVDLGYSTYVEQQQLVIRNLNVLMPILGLITILLTGLSAYLQRANKSVFLTLLLAAGFLFASGIITRVGNQPINSIVITWNTSLPPENWMELRDEWWLFHTVRMYTAVISLILIIWANIKK